MDVQEDRNKNFDTILNLLNAKKTSATTTNLITADRN